MKIGIGKKTQVIVAFLLLIGMAGAISEYGNTISLPYVSIIDGYFCHGSYCIYQPWYNSGYIYAKNGSTQDLVTSSTDITTITQAVLDMMNEGESLYVKGDYIYTAPFIIRTSGITYRHEGIATLRGTGYANLTGSLAGYVRDLDFYVKKIDGEDKDGNETAIAIHRIMTSRIEFLEIKNVGTGILLNASDDRNNDNTFYGQYIRTTYYGIRGESDGPNFNEGNKFYISFIGNSSCGICFNYTRYSIFSGGIAAWSLSSPWEIYDLTGNNIYILDYIGATSNSSYPDNTTIIQSRSDLPNRMGSSLNLSATGGTGVVVNKAGGISLWRSNPYIDLKKYSNDSSYRTRLVLNQSLDSLDVITDGLGTTQKFIFDNEGNLTIPAIGKICKYENNTLYAC